MRRRVALCIVLAGPAGVAGLAEVAGPAGFAGLAGFAGPAGIAEPAGFAGPAEIAGPAGISAAPSPLDEAPERWNASQSWAALERWAAQGRYDLALDAIERLLESSGPASPPEDGRVRLGELRARCLFELGDYPSCEKAMRALLEGPLASNTPARIDGLARLARTLTMQDLHDEALQVLEEALRLLDAPPLRRAAITVCLRACRLEEILPHAEALLRMDPKDPYAHFVRGISLLGREEAEEALGELEWGLEVPGAERDARFHLALALGRLRRPEEALEHLLEILVEDPYDEEACYQATQQLSRIRPPAGREAAGHLRRYFLTFKEAQGESSREHPFAAAGRAALAAMMRAERWRRLNLHDRTIEEVRRARAVARDEVEPFLYEAGFWASVGLFAEAESVLSRLESRLGARAGAPPEDLARKLEKLRSALAAGRSALEAGGDAPLGKARLEVADASWEGARLPLEALLSQAVRAGDLSLGDHAARLLLARDPRSVRALAFLVERTHDPALLLPRIHYLTRLVPLLPGDERYRDRLHRARAEFLARSPVDAKPPGGPTKP